MPEYNLLKIFVAQLMINFIRLGPWREDAGLQKYMTKCSKPIEKRKKIKI